MNKTVTYARRLVKKHQTPILSTALVATAAIAGRQTIAMELYKLRLAEAHATLNLFVELNNS